MDTFAVVDAAGQFKTKGRFDTGEYATYHEAEAFRLSLPNPEDYTVQTFTEEPFEAAAEERTRIGNTPTCDECGEQHSDLQSCEEYAEAQGWNRVTTSVEMQRRANRANLRAHLAANS
jgi:hypothetical protein